jgi:cobalt/nickel transport system permease protein
MVMVFAVEFVALNHTWKIHCYNSFLFHHALEGSIDRSDTQTRDEILCLGKDLVGTHRTIFVFQYRKNGVSLASATFHREFSLYFLLRVCYQILQLIDGYHLRGTRSMHIAEGILPAKMALLTSVLAVPFIAVSIQKFRRMLGDVDISSPQRPLLMMALALCFAVTLLPIPVPIAGATSHMCATPLLSLLFGWSVVPALAACILLLQALFFAHGGLTTLGANVLTLGVVGPICVMALMTIGRKLRLPLKASLFVSCTLGSLAVYVGDAFLLGWALGESKDFLRVFSAVTAGFFPVQTPLSLLEGGISTAIVLRLARENPEYLPHSFVTRFTLKTPIFGTHVIMALIFMFLSYGAGMTAYAGDFPGLDDAVFVKTAESFGMISKDIFPWIQGEIELAIFSIGFFVAGCTVGSTFRQWQSFKNHESQPNVVTPHAS